MNRDTSPGSAFQRSRRMLLFAVAAFLFTRVHFHSTVQPRYARLSDLAAGQAQTPFQYQLLTPLFARGMTLLLPVSIETAYQSVEFLAVFLLLTVYRRYLAEQHASSYAFIQSLCLLYPLLWNYCALSKLYFPSDIPAVLLFVAGLYCLERRRTTEFYATFALACLNRESALLWIGLCFAARPKEEPLGDTVLRVARLLAIWLLIRVGLTYRFLDNPGERLCEIRLERNLYFLWALLRLKPHTFRIFLWFGGLWLPAALAWRGLPRPLKGALPLTLPYFAATALCGRIDRPRALAELIPVVLTAALFWRPRTQFAKVISAAGIYLLTANLLVRVHENATVEYDRMTRTALASGVAPRPFQFRVLVPLLAQRLGPEHGRDLRTCMSLLNMAFVVVLILAYREYLKEVVTPSAAGRWCLAIAAPIIANYCALNRLYYPYDLPAIGLFTLGALCLRRRWWLLYYAVFVTATLNRETSCFLTFLLLFTHWGQCRRITLTAHVAAQFVLWVALKAWLSWTFEYNAGAPLFEVKWRDNIEFLANVLALKPQALQCVMAFALAWLAAPLVWRPLPLFDRRALWTAVPFLAGMAVVGNLGEVRIYHELVPLVTTAGVVWLQQHWPIERGVSLKRVLI